MNTPKIKATAGTAVMRLRKALPYLLVCAMLISCCGGMFVFAAEASAFESIFRVVKIITTVLGAIFLIVGIVKFVIAHANEDGPSQQKAAMMIATGIALVVIGPLMNQIIQYTSLIDVS